MLHVGRMKRVNTKKLALRPETVRVLSDDSLGRVAGGLTESCYTCPVLVTANCYPTTGTMHCPLPPPPAFSKTCFSC